MVYKNFLVHIDNSEACKARLDVALGLAQRYEAHLTGLYIVPPIGAAAHVEGGLTVPMLEALLEARDREREEAERLFSKTLKTTGLQTEWRAFDGGVAHNLILHARHCDVVVAGQHDVRDVQSTTNAIVVQMILGCGRPALVVPYIGAPEKIGQRIMVAWNGSREAVRAINDALPLLQEAQNVDVIAINSPSQEGDIPCAEICVHLARHGVQVVASESHSENIEVGEEILSRAADTAADLIVMGAYGHSRVRELVFGGATREIMNHMTVPVFMSH